ncbi:hypothetical protein [Pseudomonas asplenii]|uniref:hypothetical protein n=1 Tax=Pseudomonas asplenii TaxID=53407 RepID=UPI000369A055|nr:hypothetical protein [Pseudomonas fuscovaginae]
MIHTMLGFAAAAAVVAYWAYCRRAAVTHQMRLATLVENYLESDASAADKDCAYFVYTFARYWLYVPVMTALVPVVLIIKLVSGGSMIDTQDGEPKEARDAIIDASFKMYMTKNPITSAVFFTATAVMIGLVLPLGIIFKRLKSVPSAMDIYGFIAQGATHSQGRRHAH